MHFYFPGMIVGIIILQTSIVAPTLFKKLDIDNFGKSIRALWPKFFILMSILGAATLATLHFDTMQKQSNMQSLVLQQRLLYCVTQ